VAERALDALDRGGGHGAARSAPRARNPTARLFLLETSTTSTVKM
jgi:hypothetical protein